MSLVWEIIMGTVDVNVVGPDTCKTPLWERLALGVWQRESEKMVPTSLPGGSLDMY